MENIQSNTQHGAIQRKAGEDLTGKEGYLVKYNDAGAVTNFLLPTSVADLALLVVDDGDIAGNYVSALPLEPGRQVRVRAKGVGSGGAPVVLADPAIPADKGKIRAIPAGAGPYFSPGVAEEDFVDGQLVLLRPHPTLLRVPSADTLTALTFTAGSATGPEVAALRNAVKAILETQSLMA